MTTIVFHFIFYVESYIADNYMHRRNSLCTMDVDSPAGLKRSNSAPMINEANMATTTPIPPPRESNTFNVFADAARPRRFSASSPHSPVGPRLTPRVNQLRKEECIDQAGREVAHEREVHSAMQMSQSWEDLTLVDGPDRPKHRLTDPLHVSLPTAPPLCSSPSPTRSIRHASPSLPLWNLSPSPTRKSFATRRSLSPIALRPSSLCAVKRRFESDDDSHSSPPAPPAKRLSTGGVGGMLLSQRLSPLPGTPESFSSADSPGFFRSLDSPSPQTAASPSQSSTTSHNDEPMPDIIHKDVIMTTTAADGP